MLAAGALGGYFAYILGYNAELANFESQYYASVSQLQYSVRSASAALAPARPPRARLTRRARPADGAGAARAQRQSRRGRAGRGVLCFGGQ
jgi:hypothetical protein